MATPETTPEKIRQQIARLNVWKRGGQRAPHKPLLLLLVISRLVQGKPRLVPFPEIEEPLRELLEQYGPPRDSHHPEYPFWRLQSDGLWEVLGAEKLTRRKSNTDPLKSELRSHEIEGGLLPGVHESLREDPTLLRDVVHDLAAAAHFTESLREDLLQELGLADIAVMDFVRAAGLGASGCGRLPGRDRSGRDGRRTRRWHSGVLRPGSPRPGTRGLGCGAGRRTALLSARSTTKPSTAAPSASTTSTLC